jgi:hypothetical protein
LVAGAEVPAGFSVARCSPERCSLASNHGFVEQPATTLAAHAPTACRRNRRRDGFPTP